MVAVIGSDAVMRSIEQLNFNGSFEVQQYKPDSASIKSIEAAQGEITHLVYDIAIIGAIDKSLDFLQRLRTTASSTKIIVAAAGYDENNVFIRDVLDITPYIAYDLGAGLRSTVSRVLVADGVIGRSTPAPAPVPAAPAVMPQAAADEAAEKPYIPSQVSRREAAAGLVKPRPAVPAKAEYISVIGAQHKVGCTTQSIQIALYLKAIGYRVALIEMAAEDLREYAPEDSGNHFQLAELDIYYPDSITAIRQTYDYLILDYGVVDVEALQSITIQGYTVAIVSGSKYYELGALNEILSHDGDGFHYIFSFCGRNAKQEILDSMEHLRQRTHFAEYSPDLLLYCGNDAMYGSITGQTAKQPSQEKEKKKFGWFGR